VVYTTYYLDDQVKEIKIGGACGSHGEMINANKILDGKPEGKRSHGIWENNIKYTLGK
jgi:hypothetical protein